MNRNLPVVLALMVMCAILVVFFGNFAEKTKQTFSLADDCAKTVYLTFDDGPSDRVTPKILDILKDEHVKATFFIVGKNAQSRKDILKREVREGHRLGVHSYSHIYREIYASPESLMNDIDRCNKIIAEVVGKPSDIYRFPGGSYGLSSELISAVTERGLKYYDWNASTRDAEISGATPEQLYRAAIALPSKADGIILLAHDSTTKSATAEALRDIIRYYRSEGYVFSTL